MIRLNHPITDLNATFAATLPEDTYRTMAALREAGVYFDVTVNGPKDDPDEGHYDVFLFRKEDDQELIGRILREAVEGSST